ncbi:GNAT family N-acetyltransferase [bacterium]|nr:GNAT family N-acetyltransferase [candidate division CSSED10-310 bacterium]
MIVLRPVKSHDAPFLAHVCRSSIPLYDTIMPGVFEQLALRFQGGWLPKTYDLFIVLDDDKPCGMLGTVQLTPSIKYLVALYLLPEFQRKGIGSQVIEFVNSRSYSEGIKELLLMVHKDAFWAIQFFQKNGFELLAAEDDDMSTYASALLKNWMLFSFILMQRPIMAPDQN